MTVPQIRPTADGRREVVCPNPACTVEPIVTGFLDVARAAAKRHVCSHRPAATTAGGAA